MVNFISISFVILAALSQQQVCNGFLIDFIGFVSSVVSLKEAADGLFETAIATKSPNEIYNAIKNMNTDMETYFKDLKNIAEELPNVIHLIAKRDELQRHVDVVERTFLATVDVAKSLVNGTKYNKDFYDRFASKYLSNLAFSYNRIYDILIKDKLGSFLINDFSSELQRHENVCITGISNLQLLNMLFEKLKLATVQYYLTESIIADFYLISRGSGVNQTDLDERKFLITSVQKQYKNAAIQYKKIMSKASRGIWACDSHDYNADVRYENNPNSSYYELLAFQKLILYQDSDRGIFDCGKRPCEAIRRVDKCHPTSLYFCKLARLCSNELVNCHQRDPASVCINQNSTATARYTSIANVNGLETCEGRQYKVEQFTSSDFYANTRTCGICNCVCPENRYYINTQIILAHPGFVVTGARLILLNNTLSIEIEEGKLAANGSIYPDTVTWSHMETERDIGFTDVPSKKVMITWDQFREFELSQQMLPSDHVISGLHLAVENGRVQLMINSRKINFRTGVFDPYVTFRRPTRGKKELDLSNRDVPTRATSKNNIDSEDDQFLTLQLTSEFKDGSQTTIPFIDTQKVHPAIRVPLSGAGFVHRGQPGFGGFLGLKLYTIDITEYVVEEFESENPDFYLYDYLNKKSKNVDDTVLKI